jgi:WXXGXW repeat (2 copies)
MLDVLLTPISVVKEIQMKHVFPQLTLILSSGFAALMGSVPANAADIVSDVAPPALRAERAPAPRDGYVWASGHWELRGHDYAWVGGTWIAERRGAHWAADHWEQQGAQWHFLPGHWER